MFKTIRSLSKLNQKLHIKQAKNCFSPSTSTLLVHNFSTDNIIIEKKKPINIAMIGCGKMAEAMADGLQNTFPKFQLNINDINSNRTSLFEEKFNAKIHSKSKDCVQGADLIILSCKPQNIHSVGYKLKGHINDKTIVLSILAGTSIKMLSDILGANYIVRCMPNTPASIKEGITIWMPTENIVDNDKKLVANVLNAFGDEIMVNNEDYLDMATALSGSGPAYILLMIESMIETGVHFGFPRDIATKLVMQTFKGTIIYAETSNQNITNLREDITSPGGTTASALYTLESGGFRTTISDGLWSAYRRSLELGNKNSNIGPNRWLSYTDIQSKRA